jgi:hypothetical protein
MAIVISLPVTVSQLVVFKRYTVVAVNVGGA